MSGLRPEAALRPGSGDALALLAIWYVRKSFYWLLWLGIIGAAVVGRVNEVSVGVDSPSVYWEELLSPLAGIVLAFASRLTAAVVALGLAYPLAREYEAGLAPRTNFGKSVGILFDRLRVTRAYRSLRWTHHVRQAAIARLGRTGAGLSRLDTIIDVANIALFVLALVALAVFASTEADSG